MTALSYMGRVKYSFFPKKGIQNTNILRLSNSKAPSKVKRHLLTSYKVNDFTKRQPCEDNGNVIEYLSSGKVAGFYFGFCNLTNAPIESKKTSESTAVMLFGTFLCHNLY